MKAKSTWEINQAWLKENLPGIALKLDNPSEELQVFTKETELGWNVQVCQGKSFSFMLHSLYDREREYQTMNQELQTEYRTIIVYGCVSMDYLHLLVKKYPNIKHLIFVEPHVSLFRAFLQRWSLVEAFSVFPKVSLIVGEKEENLNYYINKALATGAVEEKAIATVGAVNYQWHFSKYAAALRGAILEALRFSRVNRATLNVFRNLWLLNTWHNLQYGDATMEDFSDCFHGKPAIIVAAGPSLDKNIHLLEEASKKALIIAVGSAMSILEAKGIKPHFRMAVDPDFENEDLFNLIDKTEIPLLFSEHLYYKILPTYEAPKVQLNLSGNSVIVDYLYKLAGVDKKNISSGFSVANVAAGLLAFWRCDPIVFVGQDLAYTEERLHAKGAWDSDVEEKYIHKHLLRKDIHGNDVYVSAPFEGMREIFEATIKGNPQLRFINATEGGVAIKGAPNRNLTELLGEWAEMPNDCRTIIKTRILELCCKKSSDMKKELLRKAAVLFKEKMESYLQEVEKSKRLAQRLLKKKHEPSEKESKHILRRIRVLQSNEMAAIVDPVFEESFGMRRAGYLKGNEELKSVIPSVNVFFLELCEKEEYVKRFLQVIGWYINGEEFKVVVQDGTRA
ncbi:motility associated factor glycosyltransferase family protein [Anaeromusa acidaminophila]|uniref:motility associated factor glycosyltransferase family protein n=1 Tax=Anaeromusa acidaminophila TaxID=81464 RepID=UPI00036E73AF|nr:6-hydroxymethylpterin diphosphokinase MptE-like protein [Anaeromusa acidaminophila]